MSRVETAWKRRKKTEYFKTYEKGHFKELEEETRSLSLLTARYEVLYVYGMSRVTVKVRCRRGSKVHQRCLGFGYCN